MHKDFLGKVVSKGDYVVKSYGSPEMTFKIHKVTSIANKTIALQGVYPVTTHSKIAYCYSRDVIKIKEHDVTLMLLSI